MKLKNQKIVVTGGAGVIGRELIKKLEGKGAIVRCFDINPKPQIFSEKIDYCQEDLSKLNPIEFINFNPEIIFHLAATFERTKEEVNFWKFNFLNNILLSHKVIDAAKECKNLQKFIFASSYLIYDPTLYLFKKPSSKPVKLKEEDKINPRNLCGAAKLYTEKELEYLSNFREEYPFNSILVRIFRVYGRGSKDVISRCIRAGIKNEEIELFLKENSFDYIFAEDVAEGLLRLAESDKAQGIVNLGSGRSKRIKEIIKIIKKQIPSLKIREVIKKDLFEASCADILKLKQLTNWESRTTLEQGIKKILDYETKQRS